MTLKSKYISYSLEATWNIGFVERTPESIVFSDCSLDIHWMIHNYKDRWFADPFILEINDDYILVLVEECRYSDHKGRIALLTVNRKTYFLDRCETIIEEPTHLSFPAYSRSGNTVYIYPESGESGLLKVYKFELNNHSVVVEKTLLADNISDAIIYNDQSKSYLTAISWPEPSTDEMLIYEKVGDEFTFVKKHFFDNKIARNAGFWFQIGNRVIRPAQDCDRRYGHALIFQEVDLPTMSFKTIKRILPQTRYNLGIHTYNYLGSLSVVDGYKYRRPLLAKSYATIVNLYHKIRGIEYRI